VTSAAGRPASDAAGPIVTALNRIHPTRIGGRANNLAMIIRGAINESFSAALDGAAFNGAIKAGRTHELHHAALIGTACAKTTAFTVGLPTIDSRTRAHGRRRQTAFALAVFIAKFSRYVAIIRQVRIGFAVRKSSNAALRALTAGAACPARPLRHLQIRSTRRNQDKNG
jgi:hypothetical protein